MITEPPEKSSSLRREDLSAHLCGMGHRLHVRLGHDEIARVRAAAHRRGVTVSEYVRRALRDAHLREQRADSAARLASVRAAANLAFPTGDPDQIEREIAAGYLDDRPPR